MKNSNFVKLIAGIGISLMFLLASLALSYLLSIRLKESIDRTEILYKVMHQMDKVLYNLSFCEGNIRGYLITKDDHFLEEFETNKSVLRNELYDLNHVQYDKEIKQFNNLLEQKMKVMDDKMYIIKAPNFKAVDLAALVNQGRTLTNAIVKFKNRLELQEMELLKNRNLDISYYLIFARYIILLSTLTSIILGIITFIITRKYLKEIKKTVNDLQELDQNKNKFFSIISHDLRAPAGRMVHLSKMVADSYHSKHKDMEKMLSMNQASAVKLMSLIDNLLLWGKSQMNKIDLKPNEVYVYSCVQQAIHLLEDIAFTKNIKLIDKVERSIAVFVDQNMLNTVIRNLIHNAIKYSKENTEVIINAKVIKNTVEITVQDFGLGMYPNEVSKLLSMENIISQPGTAKEEGSGLGLILCKEFIEKNQGSIWIESEKGKGTIILISLPLFSFETLYKAETTGGASLRHVPL